MKAISVKVHFGHCLDLIRQQLMCTADTGLVGQWWKKDDAIEFAFSNEHMCRNFEDIKVWAQTHTIPEDAKVRRKPGDKEFDPLVDY
jgi:Mycotoxin biosynthesis protein UstYa